MNRPTPFDILLIAVCGRRSAGAARGGDGARVAVDDRVGPGTGRRCVRAVGGGQSWDDVHEVV
ncbi:hypothetical protein GCM10023238_12770 [Streptomyces heliomycini]